MYSSNSIQVENGKKEYSKMREYRRPSLATSLAVIDENKCPETFEIKASSSPLLCNGIKEDDKEQIENGNVDEIESDLETLKNKANQLKLKTRRPSYVTWTSQCLINSGSLIKPRLDSVPVELIDNVNTDTDDWSEERKDKINEALSWIRNQLREMRLMDQDLARRLLDLRHEIHALKLKWSCDDHQDMLEEAKCDMEESKELKVICDIPIELSQVDDLRRIGLTKMNISSRRFSMC